MQIFPRSSNAIARASMVLTVMAVAGLFWAVQPERSPYITFAGVRKSQPVPFSHQHHVTGRGHRLPLLPHFGGAIGFAGIPPTKTCMNCHSQIWTNAAYLEPVRESFRTGRRSYGPASTSCPTTCISITASTSTKAWAAMTCHGPVDQMPLMYRNVAADGVVPGLPPCPGEISEPARQVFNMRYEQPQQAVGKNKWFCGERRYSDQGRSGTP